MAEHTDQARTTQFAVVPEWVIYGGSANAVKLYAVLDRHSNDKTGECIPSKRRLAQLTEWSEPTVRRALQELETLGAVERQPRKREDGSATSNQYRLLRDPNLTLAPVTDDGGPPVTGDGGKKNESTSEREDVTTKDVVTSAPPVVLVNGRNLPHDALARVCQIADRSPRHREIGAALNGTKAKGPRVGIRDLFWQEYQAVNADRETELMPPFDAMLATEIEHRAAMYRNVLRDATLTPLALAKWWEDLPEMAGKVGGGGFTPEDIASGRWRDA